MRRLFLFVMLLFACVGESQTQPQVDTRDSRRTPLAGVRLMASAVQVETPVGLRVWYSGNRFYEFPVDSFATRIPSLPPSGWLVAMLYYQEEYVPGKPYRMVMMGTDNFIYNPLGVGAWQFENTDESRNQARTRLGNQIIYFTGAGIYNQEYWTAVDSAFALEQWR